RRAPRPGTVLPACRAGHARRRCRLTKRLASVLAGLVLGWQPAWSQTQATSAPRDSPIETVLITAEKRGISQDPGTVPASLTVIGGAEIAQRHALALKDLGSAAPNVTLTDAGSFPGF